MQMKREKYKEGILTYNENRYVVGCFDGTNIELHCGNILKVYDPDSDWIDIRIEFNEEWYGIDCNDKKVRIWENMMVRI